MTPDWQAMAREQAALEYLELQDRVVDLEQDVAIYRMYFQETLSALHAKTVECDALRAQLHRLLDEYRALRTTLRRAA